MRKVQVASMRFRLWASGFDQRSGSDDYSEAIKMATVLSIRFPDAVVEIEDVVTGNKVPLGGGSNEPVVGMRYRLWLNGVNMRAGSDNEDQAVGMAMALYLDFMEFPDIRVEIEDSVTGEREPVSFDVVVPGPLN